MLFIIIIIIIKSVIMSSAIIYDDYDVTVTSYLRCWYQLHGFILMFIGG